MNIAIPARVSALSASALASARAIDLTLTGATTMEALEKAEAEAISAIEQLRLTRVAIRGLMAEEKRRLRNEEAARQESDRAQARALALRGVG